MGGRTHKRHRDDSSDDNSSSSSSYDSSYSSDDSSYDRRRKKRHRSEKKSKHDKKKSKSEKKSKKDKDKKKDKKDKRDKKEKKEEKKKSVQLTAVGGSSSSTANKASSSSSSTLVASIIKPDSATAVPSSTAAVANSSTAPAQTDVIRKEFEETKRLAQQKLEEIAAKAKLMFADDEPATTLPSVDDDDNDDADDEGNDPLDAFMLSLGPSTKKETKTVTASEILAARRQHQQQQQSADTSSATAQQQPHPIATEKSAELAGTGGGPTTTVTEDLLFATAEDEDVIPPAATAPAPAQQAEDDDDDEEEGDIFERLLQQAKKKKTDTAVDDKQAERTAENTAQIDFDTTDVATFSTKVTANKHVRQLKPVDHSKIVYEPFEKDFYIPPSEVAQMTEAEVTQLRKDLDGAKTWGANVPRPMKSWIGSGLSDEIMDTLKAIKHDAPFAVQSLGIPILMSGRDLVAIAKTGSGKTLTYLLPLIRHVKHQRRAQIGEGPIGLIVVPTHELAAQIVRVAEPFIQSCGMNMVSSYGGVVLRENLVQCRRGCDIMVATPGRLVDLLIANGGHTCNLSRVTFMVLDEADRLFDEGFGPHVTAFLQRVRPDRQLAFVSSTLPTELRKLAKSYLARDFIELAVGGRPSPSSNVVQTVEVFDPIDDDELAKNKHNEKYLEPRQMRLLQILGDHPDAVVIIFVKSSDLCDVLYRKLTARGFRDKVSTLYSGMDQLDREVAMRRFSKADKNIMIATGVAERGLDIENLDLVINYSMPDHYEAYVHRIGRTGRAGKRGKAVTFFVRGYDDPLAIDLSLALDQSGNIVPEELGTIAAQYNEKLAQGVVAKVNTFRRGFKAGKSYTFHSDGRQRKAAQAMGGDEALRPAADDDDLDWDSDGDQPKRKAHDPTIRSEVVNADGTPVASSAMVLHGTTQVQLNPEKLQQDRIEAAKAKARERTEQEQQEPDELTMYEAAFVVNDFGDRVRSKLISRKFLNEVEQETDTSITVKGHHQDKRREHKSTQNAKLHLIIRGKEKMNLTKVFRKFDEVIEEDRIRSERAATLGMGGGR